MEEAVVSDVVAELRALLVEATERPWSVPFTSLPAYDAPVAGAANHLGALLDVAEAAERYCSQRDGHDPTPKPGALVALYDALARLDGEAPDA